MTPADVLKARSAAASIAAPAPKLIDESVVATPEKQTYVHQIAGANTILPDGTKLTFAGRTALASEGRTAGLGYYTTDKQDEIDWMEALVRIPASQITKLVKDTNTGLEKVVYKAPDPALQEAVQDAAKNSENQVNPVISAAADNLSAVIAAAQ